MFLFIVSKIQPYLWLRNQDLTQDMYHHCPGHTIIQIWAAINIMMYSPSQLLN